MLRAVAVGPLKAACPHTLFRPLLQAGLGCCGFGVQGGARFPRRMLAAQPGPAPQPRGSLPPPLPRGQTLAGEQE